MQVSCMFGGKGGSSRRRTKGREMSFFARTRAQIFLGLLAQLRPEWLIVLVMYYLFVGGGLWIVFDGRLRADLVRPIVNGITAPVVLLSTVWYVRYLVSCLSQCRLCLRKDEVIIRGLTPGGLAGRFIEQRYHTDKLRAVAVGELQNGSGQLLARADGFSMVGFIKKGRMHVTDRNGRQVTFCLVHVAFDQGALLSFVNELSRRGVTVQMAV
ncbi:unnamed protein product [Gemmata obscuriglobus UQM 2246]|nr:unnamed protein product [Gemmata obscuriglobus UQM 2246]